jgi:hypothetical protein
MIRNTVGEPVIEIRLPVRNSTEEYPEMRSHGMASAAGMTQEDRTSPAEVPSKFATEQREAGRIWARSTEPVLTREEAAMLSEVMPEGTRRGISAVEVIKACSLREASVAVAAVSVT